MKTNLKNRPQLDIHFTPEENLERMETWFEAFEKELREEIAKADRKATEYAKSFEEKFFLLYDEQARTLRKVLGE